MQPTRTDTIAAVSTPPGEGGIGIVRISGEEALEIADRVLDRKISCEKSHTIHLRYAVKNGWILDEVLVSVMRAPRSYTGEDTVELNCHGGALVLQKVLETVFSVGARPADPGEFTRRAFLNGRMDLSQAEAVIDIIQAGNVAALAAAEQQLSGNLSEEIRDLRSAILDETAWIEAALDDPEHYNLEGYPQQLSGKIQTMAERIRRLLESADSGIVMKEGIRTVILGAPNAGKSTLMNLLSGEERAIVTEIAGTTRDTLTEHICFSGVSLNLTDTAGIRSTEDPIEKIGVEKAREAADRADLLLCVIDAANHIGEDERSILEKTRERKCIVLLNKADLPCRTGPEEIRSIVSHPVISFSARTGEGLKDLKHHINNMFYNGQINYNNQIIITSARHKAELEEALRSLNLVQKSIQNGMPEDFFSIDLMDAYGSLGRIIGEQIEDDVADRIFSKFCIGK